MKSVGVCLLLSWAESYWVQLFSVWRIFGPMNFILYVTWFISQNSKLSKLLWLVGLEIKTENFWWLLRTADFAFVSNFFCFLTGLKVLNFRARNFTQYWFHSSLRGYKRSKRLLAQRFHQHSKGYYCLQLKLGNKVRDLFSISQKAFNILQIHHFIHRFMLVTIIILFYIRHFCFKYYD